MMRWNSFGRSLGFGAVASAGLLAAAVVLVPPLPLRGLLALYACGIVPLYLMGIAPNLRRGLVAGGVAGLLAGALWLLPLDLRSTVAGAAVIIAGVRSGMLYGMRPARALVTEAALVTGGIALADFLAAGGLASLALGLWGFFLVQSLFFLVGGVSAREVETAEVDPFDRARSRLLALIE